jgi:hypothetical protein
MAFVTEPTRVALFRRCDRSPASVVWLVPSVMSRTAIRLLRKGTPSPSGPAGRIGRNQARGAPGRGAELTVRLPMSPSVLRHPGAAPAIADGEA